MACRLKKFGINYEIYDLDSPVWTTKGTLFCLEPTQEYPAKKSSKQTQAVRVLCSHFRFLSVLYAQMCVKLTPPHSPLATRCASLGVLSTPESCLAWPAVRSTYVSCLLAEISFLSISILGLVVWWFFQQKQQQQILQLDLRFPAELSLLLCAQWFIDLAIFFSLS